MAIQTPPNKKPSVKPGEDRMAQAQVIKRPPVVMPAPPKKVIVPARTVLKNSTPKAAPAPSYGRAMTVPKTLVRPPVAPPTDDRRLMGLRPSAAIPINPRNTPIGARGGGGEPPPEPKRTMGLALSEKFGRLPSNPLQDISALLNYAAPLFQPQSELVNVNPAQIAMAQRMLGESTTPTTGFAPAYPGNFNYIPPAGAVVLPKTPTGAATSNNTGVGGGFTGQSGEDWSVEDYMSGRADRDIKLAPPFVPMPGGGGFYDSFKLGNYANPMTSIFTPPVNPAVIAAVERAAAVAAANGNGNGNDNGNGNGNDNGVTNTSGGGGVTDTGPGPGTNTGGGFFGPQSMADMMAMFTQMKDLFGDAGGAALDQIMGLYTELQKSMMDLQNKYIQSLIDAQKPVAPPVAPAPNLGPEAFVPPYISPTAQNGAYLEMSDAGMGALYNMNPMYLQSVRQMLQDLKYTGAGVTGRYGERTYVRPGGPGSLAIGDAAYENAANYVGLPATERENAEAAMRYFFGEMGNSPRYQFPGRPQYPTRA